MKQINYGIADEGGNGRGEESLNIEARVDGIVAATTEILQESPKMLAWRKWLQDTGYAFGRKEDDIEMNGDIVIIKIPGHKDLIFNPIEYVPGIESENSVIEVKYKLKGKTLNGNGISIDNKFSGEDFEQLILFLGGDNSKGYYSVGEKSNIFLIEILGLFNGASYGSRKYGFNSSQWRLFVFKKETFFAVFHPTGNDIPWSITEEYSRVN